MAIISEVKNLFPYLEGGDLNAELSNTMRDTQAHLAALAQENPRGTFKAKVTIELELVVRQGGEMIEISAKNPKVKLPDLPRKTTHLFLLDDGTLSTEHQHQTDWVGGPRIVDPNRHL